MQNNMMQMFMQMLQSGKVNSNQLMQMFGNNPMMKQAQQMLNNGGNPKDVINNIAKTKGIEQNQLQQIAQMFGIKL